MPPRLTNQAAAMSKIVAAEVMKSGLLQTARYWASVPSQPEAPSASVPVPTCAVISLSPLGVYSLQ